MDEKVLSALKALLKDGYPGLVDDYIASTRFQIQMITIRMETGHIREILNYTHVVRSSSAMLGFMRLSRIASALEDMVIAHDQAHPDATTVHNLVRDMRAAFIDVEKTLQGEVKRDSCVVPLKTISGCV